MKRIEKAAIVFSTGVLLTLAASICSLADIVTTPGNSSLAGKRWTGAMSLW